MPSLIVCVCVCVCVRIIDGGGVCWGGGGGFLEIELAYRLLTGRNVFVPL